MRWLAKIGVSLLLLVAVLAPAAPVYAWDLFGDACNTPTAQKNRPDTPICNNSGGDDFTTSTGLIKKVTSIVAIFGGIVAVIVLGIGGVRYIVSNGDAEQVARSKRTIIYAIIGLVVIVLGQAIINFVLRKL